jgi:hypothetical protein
MDCPIDNYTTMVQNHKHRDMVSLSQNIPLASVPRRIRKKVAAGSDVNLAGIGRSLEPPVSKVVVSQVLHGRCTSRRVREALEHELSRVLTPGNPYGWWPGKPKGEGAGAN